MANIQNAQRDTITINRNGTTVEGIVTDRNGVAIAGVMVVLTNARTKKQVIVTTDRFGNYSEELDAQAQDKILVHAEFKRNGQIVVINGVAVLTKNEATGQLEFELVDNGEAVDLLETYASSIRKTLSNARDAVTSRAASVRKATEEAGV